jgi:hypothetical protein
MALLTYYIKVRTSPKYKVQNKHHEDKEEKRKQNVLSLLARNMLAIVYNQDSLAKGRTSFL